MGTCIFVYSDNLIDVEDVNYRYIHEKFKINIKTCQNKGRVQKKNVEFSNKRPPPQVKK